jgi:hypothetical protein
MPEQARCPDCEGGVADEDPGVVEDASGRAALCENDFHDRPWMSMDKIEARSQQIRADEMKARAEKAEAELREAIKARDEARLGLSEDYENVLHDRDRLIEAVKEARAEVVEARALLWNDWPIEERIACGSAHVEKAEKILDRASER